MIFNAAQEVCLNSQENRILVNASAGTGKTTVLVEAARRSIAEGKKTVVITFTRDAAEMMEDKLTRRADFTGTIHGFALREIKKIEETYLLKSKIMKDIEIKELLVQALMNVDDGIKNDYKQKITKILSYMSGGFYEDRKEINYFFKVLKEYDKLKKEYDLYDHNDSPQYLLELIQRYRWKLDYDAYYVDEIQDIDIHEFNLINKFKGKVFLIGDPKQAIYLFRDSIENVFEEFEKLGYWVYILTDNYRSYQEILDYAGADLDANRGTGGVITSAAILRSNPKTQVLCRTNREVLELSYYLENVCTIHAFKGLEADEVLVVDFPVGSAESKNIKFVALTRAKNVLGVDNFYSTLKIAKEIKSGYKQI